MQTKNSPVGGGVFGLEIYRVAFIGHREVDEHRQVRRLVEYIRVMKDKTIIIVLKGGMQIQEYI